MQGIASAINESGAAARPVSSGNTVAGSQSAYQGYQILRRNGAVVAFEPSKIAVALMKAFLAVHGTQGAASASVREASPCLVRAAAGDAREHPDVAADPASRGLRVPAQALPGLPEPVQHAHDQDDERP